MNSQFKPNRIDYRSIKLGKRRAVHDPRTLSLVNYLKPKLLPAPPASIDYGDGIAPSNWGMMGNDTISDCTCAAAGHLMEMWTDDATGAMRPVSTEAIIQAYSAISGYNPITGQNDNGAVELDVLKYWRDTGIAGDKITAFAALEPNNHYLVQQAIFIFGGCYIGLELPLSAQDQSVWTVPPGGPVGQGAPGSWGGHAVPVIAHDQAGLTVVTWGTTQQMTWAFWDAYCDEAYAIISADFIPADELTPSGFDLQTLLADLQEVIAA